MKAVSDVLLLTTSYIRRALVSPIELVGSICSRVRRETSQNRAYWFSHVCVSIRVYQFMNRGIFYEVCYR
jgi:hypothetical protein